jgi:uncharacterized protein
MSGASLFGMGPSFPMRVDAAGGIAWSAGESNVAESIRVILGTEPGERLFRPEFGAGLRSFLWKPNTVTTRQLLVDRIEKALARDEARIRVESVVANRDAVDPEAVVIEIRYRLVATQSTASLNLTVKLGA